MSDTFDWLDSGHGVPPEKRWSFTIDAPLVAVQLARETGEVLAADASGGLYLFDRRGQLATLTRGFHALGALAWCDTGTCGAAAVDESRLIRFDRQLKVEWSVQLPDAVVSVATDPFGNCLAAGLADGRVMLYDAFKRKIGEFASFRPLRHLHFLATLREFVAASEYGLICRMDLSGQEVWADKNWANVGDVAATGDGGRVYVAGFNHGIRILDGEGRGRGSWMVEGTANRIDCSFAPSRVAATTLERHLYWLDDDGEMLWGANLPDEPAAVRVDPLGTGLVLGLAAGRLIRLEWPGDVI